MAILNKKPSKTPSFEESNEIKKLSLYITIVNKGVADPIISLMRRIGSSVQIVQVGQGTATKEVYDILGIEDDSKEVILSTIKTEQASEVQKELEIFFAMNKKNKGIGFAIDLTSIIGVRLYRFLSNTL